MIIAIKMEEKKNGIFQNLQELRTSIKNTIQTHDLIKKLGRITRVNQ